jgi:pimeloyl-ACP methyl ester carboxylesterase
MTRPTLVFVHGAWHGPWCWAPVRQILGERGWTTVAPELPTVHAADKAALDMMADADAVRAAAEADAAAARLTTQNLRAYETEVTATAWRGRPTTYLITERDAIFPVAPQEALAGRAGSSTVRLATSHSPFLSQPRAVADIIERVADQVPATVVE